MQINQHSIIRALFTRETLYSVDNFAFDGGITLGYQHYFGESQKFGIGTSLYIGVGIPTEGKFEIGLDDYPIDLLFYQLNTSIPSQNGI